MKILVTILLFISFITTSNAQDILVLKSGKRIPYSKIDLQENSVDIITHVEKVDFSFPPDSILGYCSPTSERNFYVKPNPEFYGGRDYQFIERVEVGVINLYKRKNKSGDLYLFMEKGDRFENTYLAIATGKRKKEKLKIFTSFFEDDEESIAYINSSSFKFRPKDITEVIQYYNRRNFKPNLPNGTIAVSSIFLYRTSFQKVKHEIKIACQEEEQTLKINDYIKFDLPIEYASEMILSGKYVENKKLLSAEMMDQYFEVVYDQKTKTFVLEKKEGSELQYEFYKIKNKTSKD